MLSTALVRVRGLHKPQIDQIMQINQFLNFFKISGSNVVCVKSLDNEVRLKTKGCEEFEINPDTLDLKNLDRTKVNLKPVKYSVSGRISSKEKIPDLKVLAKSETRMVELELEPVDNIGYKFNLMAYPGKNVSLFLFV